MSQKDFIDGLQKECVAFLESRMSGSLAALLNTVSTDIYSESERFIFELIQNADDSALDNNNEVHFNFLPNYLIVSHNGKTFDEQDVLSLTSAGASTKKADLSKTGYKGIGFKSVFGKSEKVIVLSGGFQFRFDKSFFKPNDPWQMMPIWTEIKGLPSKVQDVLAKNNFNVSTIIETNESSLLQEDLNKLLVNGEILLFLRRVARVSVSKNGALLFKIEKKIVSENNRFNEINILKSGKKISSWIMKTFDQISVPNKTKEALIKDTKTPDKLLDGDFTEISFAAKILDGKIQILSKEDSLLFTYLPTKVTDFEFPFLINGSFMTNAAREAVHQDAVWNQWLFELIAEKLLDWLVLIADSNYKLQVLKLLPKVFNSNYNALKKSFDESFINHVPNKAFITSSKGNLKKTTEIVLDKTGLSNQAFIHPKSITDYFNFEENTKFGEDCFVHPNLEKPEKLVSVGVKTFELKYLDVFFASKYFVSRHNVPDNFSLIKYLKQMSDNDKDGIWFESLKTLPFIFDDTQKLYNPENGICFPIGIKSTELGDMPVVHPLVFESIQTDNIVFDWLKKLGVKEPSELAYVTNVIIPGLKTPNFITDANYLKITRHLFRLFNEKLLTDAMLEGLRELPLKSKAESFEVKQAQYCFLPKKFRPQLPIEGIINDVSFVSEDYIESSGKELEWNLFFKAIKVKDKVEIEEINNNNSLPTMRDLTSPKWVEECKNKAASIPGSFGFNEANIIASVKIPTFLNFTTKNYKYSQMFWDNIIGKEISLKQLLEKAVYRYGEGRGKNNYGCSVENYFSWFIKNQECIPTSMDKLMQADKVYINDKEIKQIAGKHLPVFDFDDNIPPDWREFLNLRTSFQLEDYLFILKSIKERAEDEEKTLKPSVKQIGLIYNKLASLMPTLTEEKLQTISDWTKTNSLLTIEGNFETAQHLNWITIDGFDIETDKFKIINIPDNCEKTSPNLRLLLEKFGVNLIDTFVPTFQNEFLDFTLKEKLEAILPYYSSLAAKSKVEDVKQEFERLYEILNKTEFYQASEINLSFNHSGTLIAGPSQNVLKQNNKIYFSGKWTSGRIQLFLLKELAQLFDVTGLNEELRFLLLENDENEILRMLDVLGIDKKNTPATRRFTKQIETTQHVAHENAPKVVENISNNLEVNPVTHVNTITSEVFTPTISAKDVEFTVTPVRKTVNVNNSHNEVQYREITDEASRFIVGNWSEEFVAANISKWGNYTNIVWENEKEESGKPYDFRVTEDGQEKFVEVKGTPSSTKDLIYLSPAEWNLMRKEKNNYFIIRIYNAGYLNAYPEIFENPCEQIDSGNILVALRL